jgi:hypothetical protein
VVVSESSLVRVFDDGVIIGEILPELWLVSRESMYISHPRIEEKRDRNITVVTQENTTQEL